MTIRSQRFTVLALALFSLFALASVAVAAGPPRVSPAASVTQTVGLAEVSIRYSRPSVRERVIFGELVPWGEVWRTGANEATTITLSHDAEIAGSKLAAGTYALFTIPGQDSWTLIFNRQAEQWGAFQHDPAQDALRVKATPQAAPFAELMTFGFPAVSADATTVHLHWAETAVPFEIRFDTAAIASAQASAEIAADGAGSRTASNWATYFYQQGSNGAAALKWASAAAAENENYSTVALKARLQARNGDFAAAAATAAQALALGAKAVATAPSPRMQGDMEMLRKEMADWNQKGM
jgi:hypothetical protein